MVLSKRFSLKCGPRVRFLPCSEDGFENYVASPAAHGKHTASSPLTQVVNRLTNEFDWRSSLRGKEALQFLTREDSCGQGQLLF
jgi:hypothetical protein